MDRPSRPTPGTSKLPKAVPAAISQIEQNQVSPSVASLRKLVGALGLTLGSYFSGPAAEPRQVFFRGADLQEIGSGDVSIRQVGALRPGAHLQCESRPTPPAPTPGR